MPQQMNGETDPLGRQSRGMKDDGSVKLPAHMQTRRAREIVDELRRRSNQYDRPKIEREYIERLLERF
jgi:hypothetical protein